MSLALDIGVAALIVICLIGGLRRGAARTLINLLGTVAAITVSIWLGGYISQWVYATFFKDNLIHNMSEQIMASGGTSIQSGVHSALESLPDFVVKLLPNFGIDATKIGPAVQGTADATAKAVEAVIAPVVTALLAIVVVLVLLIVFRIAVRLVAHALDMVFHLPVLHGVNSFFGAVLGLLEGVAGVFIVVFFIKLFVPTLSDAPEFLNRSVIEGTYLFKYFYQVIPLSGILTP